MSNGRTDIIASAMRNRNIIMLITAVLMAVGIVALLKMPRNEFPQFTIRQGVIVGVYPGATSAEVESQLTKVVENYIFGYQEIKKAKTYSYSREGIMYIFVELNDNVKNADQFWSKLKHGLDELKMSLPSGVLALVANSDFGDTSALLITLSSDTRSYKELEENLKKLETECRKIPATSKIKHFGLQKEKIFINVKPELLNEYNIKTLSLLGTYQINGMVNYAGVLKDGKNNLAVHLPANFESEKDLEDHIVYSDPMGNVVRLKNIASIERRYEDPDNYIKQNGKKTILLSLEMQPGNNIVKYGEDVGKAISGFQKTCPEDIKIAKISELPKYVNDSVSNFLQEFLIAIIAVILVTMLLLPLRVASVAGITVPISVLMTLGFLYFFGVELHTVSLASLILVLGMIVDNSIVVIDNHVEKIDQGFSVWHASIMSAKELFIPIVTATLAIIATYVPLGLMIPGTAGEFLLTIPIVVSTALVISIIVATLLVPYLNFIFIKKGLRRNSRKGKSFLDWLQGKFDKLLEKSFRHPRLVVGSGIILIIVSFIIFKSINQQLFPELERNQFAVEVYLPTGSSIESTAKVVDSLENMLLKDRRVINVTSFIGTSSPRFQVAYAPNMPSPNYGQLLINTTSDKATRAIVNDYSDKYVNYFENAHVKFKVLALQLNKASIEVRITSDSIKDIRLVEKQVNDILKKTEHIAWARTDWDQKQQNIKVKLDRDKANRMGYSKGFVATSLMAGLEGLPLTTIWENDYPVEVRLTQEDSGSKSISTLENQYITSLTSFSSSPLRSFASLSPEWTEGTIVHRNGTPTLTIFIDNEINSVAANTFDEIRPQVDKLKLPEGTTINWGGDYEGQVEVFTPMTIALGLSIIIIFFIILFQFKKIKLSLLIMSTMILTIPGAAIGLILMGYPFSITAFVGISSLCGMVVRNGIILIDYARDLREKNKKITLREAAIAAGKRRMRPIFLTSAAASVGVVPMIISRSPLWGPLGTVICFGLLISMILTLFILPILYYWISSDKPEKRNFWSVPSRFNIRRTVSTTTVIFILIAFTVMKGEAQSLSLDSCKSLSLKNNIKIRNSKLEIEASRQVKKGAFTKFFPNVSATGMYMKFDQPLIEYEMQGGNLPVFNGNPMTIPLATEFAYFPGTSISMLDKMKVGSIMATQPVFAGRRIMNGNKLASLGMRVSEQKLKLSEREVIIRTEEKYWQIVSLNEKIKTIELYKRLLETLYKDAGNAFQAGLINHNDVIKVSLKQNEILLNKIKIENGKKLAMMAFCQHLGIDYDPSITLSDSVGSCYNPSDLYTDHHKALLNREEYQMLQEGIKAERLQTRIKTGGYLPELAVGAGAFTYDINNEWSDNMMLFGSLTIPISNWWEASHTLKERRIKEQMAQNSADTISDMLILQMEKLWIDLEESYKQVILATNAIKLAEENLKIANDNFYSGVNNVSDLLEAQAILQASSDSLTEASCNFQVKKARYLLVTGKFDVRE